MRFITLIYLLTTALLITACDSRGIQTPSAALSDPKTNENTHTEKFTWGDGTKILIVGGGTHHDFRRWFGQEDVKTLQKDPQVSVNYTENIAAIPEALKHIDILYMSHNQPMEDAAINQAIEDFVDQGGGLLLVHAAIWKNWNNWDSYYRKYVAGHSMGHDKYGLFEVAITNREHPVTRNLPATFQITDELYYHFPQKDAQIIVLAQATSEHKTEQPKHSNSATYNVLWEVKHPRATIICMTLGHDGASHQDEAYFQQLLRQSVKYIATSSQAAN